MNKFNFEEALQQLDSLVAKMETDLDLEASLKHFEQGVTLIRQCQTALKQAEQKVQILIEKNDQTILEDYENK